MTLRDTLHDAFMRSTAPSVCGISYSSFYHTALDEVERCAEAGNAPACPSCQANLYRAPLVFAAALLNGIDPPDPLSRGAISTLVKFIREGD